MRPSAYNKLFRVSTPSKIPKIGYPNQWVNGNVRIEMLEGLGGTFKRSSSQGTHPTLRGTNAASLWATFGTEGAQLMWGLLKPPKPGTGGTGTQDRSLMANIYYELDGWARCPALKVSVRADGKAVYQEIRRRTQIHERVNGSHWSYPQVSELTKSLSDSRVLTIDWQDFGIPGADPQADEIRQQLQGTVMGIITNQIVTMFFKPFEVKGVQQDDLGQTFTHTLGGKPGSRLWLNDYKEEQVSNIDFTLNQSTNVKFKVYPQTSLLASLTPEQLEQACKIVDVGSPEIRVMSVQIQTNADFQADKIANITVTLSYRQHDTLVNQPLETSDTYVFRTGQEVFTFRTRLARDQNGKLIDLYDAKAQINYIGTSKVPPPIELKNVSDRALTFSYDRLGFVKVQVQAGDIDWSVIKDVYVDLLYEAAQNEPDAKGIVRLTQEVPLGAWSSSKHGATSNRYKYTVRYVFKDGREQPEPGKFDERGTLIIHDKLVSRLRRAFDVVLDPQTVESLLLKVRYEDPPAAPEEARQQFTSSNSWEYVRAMREGAPQMLKYSYDINYKDGQPESVPWRPVQAADDLPAIRARRYRFGANSDGEGLDWNKWRTVLVEVAYRDAAHDYVKIEELRLTKDRPFAGIDIWAFSPEAREYEYRAEFVPRDGSDSTIAPESGGTQKHRGTLLLDQIITVNA